MNCPHCAGTATVRDNVKDTGLRRYRCHACRRRFTTREVYSDGYHQYVKAFVAAVEMELLDRKRRAARQLLKERGYLQ